MRLGKIAVALAALICSNAAHTQQAASAPPDPFVLTEMPGIDLAGYRVTAGLTIRSPVIDPAKKTLILITAGQSNFQNVNPTLYTPTNSAVVDNFNIYDGATYSIGGPLLGTPFYAPSGSGRGPGNISARVADLFVTNAVFDRVIIVPVAVGATVASDWASGGRLYDRIAIALARLSSRGITTATTGATFAVLWGQGENDTAAGTTQVSYASSISSIITRAFASGLSGGRFFVNKETWTAGGVSSAVQAAQVAAPNGSTVFIGGDLDTLNATNRTDNTHFNDTGAASAATLIYNAMHASGAPF